MITQAVTFKGGKSDGKTAHATFTAFKVGMEFMVDGELYKIGDGPIARIVERFQKGVEHGCLVAVFHHNPINN